MVCARDRGVGHLSWIIAFGNIILRLPCLHVRYEERIVLFPMHDLCGVIDGSGVCVCDRINMRFE